jgi:hypothetical protein
MSDLVFNVDVNKLNDGNLKMINEKGFTFPSDEEILAISEDDKMFPTDLSEFSSEDLLNKMAVFTALYSSVSVNEALAMTKVAGYEREFEIRKGQVMQLSSSSKVTDKRQEALVDKEVVKLQEKLTVAESRLKLLSALRASYDRYYQLFSRALTSQIEEKKIQ